VWREVHEQAPFGVWFVSKWKWEEKLVGCVQSGKADGLRGWDVLAAPTAACDSLAGAGPSAFGDEAPGTSLGPL